MAESNIIHGTADQLPKVSQKLKLSCRKCGEQGVYNVGAIFSPPAEKEDSQRKEIAFTNYFRCDHCGSAGPWDVVDYLKLTGLLIKSVFPGAKGFQVGYLTLFDGTFIQTPAREKSIY